MRDLPATTRPHSTEPFGPRLETLEPRMLMAADPIQILAIGDSITVGVGSVDQSYRAELTRRLDRDGVAYNMVGSISDGNGYDNDYYGFQGSRAAVSYTNSSGLFRKSLTDGFRDGEVLRAGEKPDVILLHIGTNTVRNGVAGAADELRTLLDEMADQWRAGAFATDVKVLLAQIVPGARADNRSVDPQRLIDTENYNDRIPSIVGALSDQGFANRITIVDFFQSRVDGLGLSGALYNDAQNDGDPWVDWFSNVNEADPQATATGNPDLMRDGDWLHPTESGYAVMGAIWHRALQQSGVLDDSPVTPTPPTPPLVLENLPGSFDIAGRGDFDGDGDTDYVFTDRNSDATLIRLSENGRVAVETAGPDVDSNAWAGRARADFNNDGTEDLLWVSQSGKVAVWRMNGTNVEIAVASQNAPAASRFDGVADRNNDGFDDITWTNRRGTFIWEMRNGNLNRVDRSGVTSRPAATAAPAGFNVVLNADLDGDGRNDRVYRNPATGVTQIRFGDGTVSTMPTTESWITPRPATDLDGDGDLDIRWISDGQTFLEWTFENGRIDSIYYPIFRDNDGSIDDRRLDYDPDRTSNPTDYVTNDRELGLDLVLNNWGNVNFSNDFWSPPSTEIDQNELDRVLTNWGSDRTNLSF